MYRVFLGPRATAAVVVLIAAFAQVDAVDAGPFGNPFSQTQPRPADGRVQFQEFGPNTPKTTINLTDAAGKDITTGVGWPKDLSWVVDTSLGRIGGSVFWKASVTLPAKVQKQGTGVEGKPPEFIDVADYRSSGKSASGAVYGLNVESIFQDPVTGTFFVDNVFGMLAIQGGFVSIPRFGADTNLDGDIGTGDSLFELVNLNIDLRDWFSFALGDVLTASDGAVVRFPGMFLSTTPFVFDSTLGFVGTPYTGAIVIVGSEELSTIPEPGTWVLVLSGLAGLIRRQHAGADEGSRDARA